MDYTSLNADNNLPILSLPPRLHNFELDALIWHKFPVIQATVDHCFKGWTSKTRTRVGREVLVEVMKNKKLWIFVEGDQDYCLTNNHSEEKEELDLNEEEKWKLLQHDVFKQMLEPDDAFLQLVAQTTPAMRIGMIIWLVITSLAVQDYHDDESAWDKWDLQGRAITIWADMYSEIIRSHIRPSEAIFPDGDAVAAFHSAMDVAGHQHTYQATPDVGAWVTMRAALFPELRGTELACWHFNDEDGCVLCDKRFRQKIQSETGLNHIPPLHLVALWEYFHGCEDFEERLAFAVVQRPHLFLPEIVKPVEELLAPRFPEKTRRRYSLHYRLSDHDPLVDLDYSDICGDSPPWQKIADMIDSLGRFAPRWGGHYFPPTEPIFWFDMVRVLGGQYQSQHKGKDTSWTPRVSLAVAHELDDTVFGKHFPPLDLNLLPEHVQRAVKQFSRATADDAHACGEYHGFSWGKLDIKRCTRYAAAYTLLYSTELVPLLGDNNNNCDACDDIRALYDCVDKISAGQLILGSQNIAKVLGFIKRSAVISAEWKFVFPEDRSDIADSDDRPDLSRRPDAQQRGGNSEVIHDETHNAAIITENDMNPFNPTPLIQLEADDPVWSGDSAAPQIYDNLATGQGSLVEYRMTEAHTSAQEHVGEFINLRWGTPREDLKRLPLGGLIPHSALGGFGGLHVAPDTNWSTKQSSEFMTTSNVAGVSRLKDSVGPKISKATKIRELHAFFVALFKSHGVPLGTTGMADGRLPWKKMTYILAEQGLEVSGWPEGVPKPRSDGKADKGISGFNMDHVAALYKAMKAGQIYFRPLSGGSLTNDASRVRQREDDMEDEVDIQPTKKGKLAETKKKPKDFLAIQSVMKF